MSDTSNAQDPDLVPSATPLDRLKTRLRKIAGWRRDEMLRKLYRNAAMLVAGEGFGAVLTLGTIALATRGLGRLDWGVLATVIAFTHLIGSLIKFQTWQAVVKYGADALEAKDPSALRRLLSFTALLDLATALVAFAVCIALAPVYADFAGLPAGTAEFLTFYSLSALFAVSATPIGVLRLLDRFDLLAGVAPIGPALRLGLVAVAYATGGGLWEFGAAWLAASAVERVMMIALGWRELRRRGLLAGATWSPRGLTAGHPGLWRFVIAGNLQSSLNALGKEADTLIVQKFVGTEEAGLWTLAKRYAGVLSGPSRLFVVSIFPQLSKLWAADGHREFRRLTLRSSLTSGVGAICIVALFAALGETLIRWINGPEYVGAFFAILLFLASRSINVFASPFNPAMLAMGRAVKNLKLAALTTAFAIPAMALLSWQFGLLGAGLARVLTELLILGVLSWTVFRLVGVRIRAARRAEAQAAAGD